MCNKALVFLSTSCRFYGHWWRGLSRRAVYPVVKGFCRMAVRLVAFCDRLKTLWGNIGLGCVVNMSFLL